MPIHPSIASRFPLVDGIESFEAGFADPLTRARLQEFMSAGEPTPLPPVDAAPATAAGPHGPVPLRIYRPTNGSESGAVLIWLHGGAFRSGGLDTPEADRVSREICHRAGAVVVSVDYRLAVGGVTYPVPHDDVVAAVRWVRDNASDLGIDRNRITVGGASAGGNLAAGAALRLRDTDNWLPAALLLVYTNTHPVTPPPTATLADVLTEVPPLFRFTPENRRSINCNYLGGPESGADGYAMPAVAVLDGLCPVLLLNAEYDDVRASGQAFAAALAVAGVDVRQVLVPGMLHGFLNESPQIPPVDETLGLMAELVVHARSATAGADG